MMTHVCGGIWFKRFVLAAMEKRICVLVDESDPRARKSRKRFNLSASIPFLYGVRSTRPDHYT